MDSQKKNETYIEDSFELEEFRKETARIKAAHYRKKYQPVINALSFIILILFFILGVLAYNTINFYMNLWQNNQIRKKAQNITTESRPSEKSDSAVSFFSCSDDPI